MSTNSTSVQAAAGLVTSGQKAYSRKWTFLVTFVLVLFITTGVAGVLDLLPEAPQKGQIDSQAAAVVAAPALANLAPELPTKIEIPAIGLTQKVANPESTDVEALDHALLSSVVRYPTSSKLGVEGNVIIFGHSSYLPIVNNKEFKAFNGIQKLKAGDRITVTGSGHAYVYAVQAVEKKSATDDSIPLTVTGSTLTLATCDSFGQKSDRFVVTATLVETDAL